MQLVTWSMAWGLIKIILLISGLALLAEAIKMIPTWIMDAKARAAGVDKVDSMNGEMFEKWLAHQFSKAGYIVERTPYQKDHGADLIVTKPEGAKIAIQAKKFSKRKDRVGAKALGEVLRGKKYYKCDEAMMITNQGYTQQAKDEAHRIGIELVDRKKLIKFVEKTKLKAKDNNKKP